MKKHTKTNNKGFTLVELIIVVAIIAVLAAVLAPQYLRYVERARESNDLQIATNLVKAATVAAADPKSGVPSNAIIEVIWATGHTDPTFTDWILVREASGSSRTSKFVPTSGAYTSKMASVEELQKGIIGIMGYTAQRNGGTHDWYAVMDKAQSAAADANSFVFHLDMETGDIAVAYHPVDGTANAWIDEIGVNIGRWS